MNSNSVDFSLQIIAGALVVICFIGLLSLIVFITEDYNDDKHNVHSLKLISSLERRIDHTKSKLKNRIIDIENTINTMFYEHSITIEDEMEENRMYETKKKASETEESDDEEPEPEQEDEVEESDSNSENHKIKTL